MYIRFSKRFKRKLKNAILKLITAIAVITAIIIPSCVDPGLIEVIVFVLAMEWIFLFGLANGLFDLYEDDWR